MNGTRMNNEDRKAKILQSMSDCYFTVKCQKKTPADKYRPRSEYGKLTKKVADILSGKGPMLSMFVPQDQLLRQMVFEAIGEDEYMRGELASIFPFLEEEPSAVSEWFSVDDFDAIGVDMTKYGGTKKEKGARLMCARLNPRAFRTSVCKIEQPLKMSEYTLGIEMTYVKDPRWSLFGYVPPASAPVPAGNYMLCTNASTTDFSCICGSRSIERGYMVPIAADVQTLRDINKLE